VRVLFWGTPEFAAPALRALLGEGFDVLGVVTQPDRAVGRSRSAAVPSPVKRIAMEEGLPALQPDTPREPSFREHVSALAPDISVVVAYGHILPADVIGLPRFGTVNVHASLLPALRGAAPIQGAILAGLPITGVTVMRIVPALDAGPVLLQSETPVADDETAGELQLRLSELGALAIVEALTLLELGGISEIPQDETRATYAPKITREMARIDFGDPCIDVARAIRAYDPKPGAYSNLRDGEVRLFGARAEHGVVGDAGEVLGIDERGMLVSCPDGGVRISYVHPAGRRRMTALGWSHGRGVQVGDRLGTARVAGA
jgi:methionyl-tRNA formyltransferase